MNSGVLSALEEVLSGLDELRLRGILRESAGSSVVPAGFARLA